MTEIEWGEPPPVDTNRSPSNVWPLRLEPFKAHPGQWGLLGRYHSATCQKIRKGHFGGIAPGEFETVMRNTVQKADGGDGKGDLYIRYIGPKKTK